MMQPDPTAPRGALIVTQRKSGDRTPQWEACWRDSTGRRIKRRLGPAFLIERAEALIDVSGWAAAWRSRGLPMAGTGPVRPAFSPQVMPRLSWPSGSSSASAT